MSISNIVLNNPRKYDLYCKNLTVTGSVSGVTGATGPTGPVGMTWQGQYQSGTYAKNDAVGYSGSSFISTINSNTGAPSNGGLYNILGSPATTYYLTTGIVYDISNSFSITTNLYVNKLRFYKVPSDPDNVHTMSISKIDTNVPPDITVTQLVSVNSVSETADGWQEINLTNPLYLDSAFQYIVTINNCSIEGVGAYLELSPPPNVYPKVSNDGIVTLINSYFSNVLYGAVDQLLYIDFSYSLSGWNLLSSIGSTGPTGPTGPTGLNGPPFFVVNNSLNDVTPGIVSQPFTFSTNQNFTTINFLYNANYSGLSFDVEIAENGVSLVIASTSTNLGYNRESLALTPFSIDYTKIYNVNFISSLASGEIITVYGFFLA